MTRHAYRIVVPLLGAALALGLTACAGSSGTTSSSHAAGPVPDPKKPVTITFASWVGSDPTMQALSKEFHKEHPNITVKFENIPSDSENQKLTTQIAGGNPPDAAFVDASSVASFSTRGALVNLDDYIARDKVVKPSDYVQAFKTFVTYKGSMYGLPIDGESTGLFYRTDMFKAAGITAPPKTWDELQADAQKLTDPAKKQYGYALFAPEAAYYWYPYLWQAGGQVLSKDGTKVEFDSPAGQKAADFYVGLKRYAPPDYLNSNSWDGRVAFEHNQVAMYMAGSWFAGTITQEAPKITGKWNVAPLPCGPSGCATTVASDALVEFSGSPNKDAAYKWIEFLSKPANMAKWTYESPGGTELPTIYSLLNSQSFKSNTSKPYMEGFAQQMKYGVANIQANKNWPQMETALSDALGKAIYGNLTPKQALDTAAQKASGILQQ
ncbi:MAG TPA: sugar ABC transporter substrate-binding protein [Amnibacterium sp.]|nr:sugar ABC transporter substrate-binding protein [Amnibacterium sp.]